MDNANSAYPLSSVNSVLLSEVFDLLNDAILGLDIDGRLLFWNRAAEALYGWKRTEVLHAPAYQLLQTRFPDSFTAVMENVRKYGEWRGELVHTNRAGQKVFVESRWVARRNAGALIGTFEILHDITAQKEIAERAHLQLAALEAAANAVVITDRTGRIVWVNTAFTDLTGYSRQESLGKTPRILKSCEHDVAFYQTLWETIQSGHVWRGEVHNRKKDGSLYTEEMKITPVCCWGGEITHFIAIKQDVSERKRLEEQFRQAQKMEAVGRLAGGIAHDFNNVLGVIIGYSDMSLVQTEKGSPLEDTFGRIKGAADRAAGLTRQLLGFSRQQIAYPRIIDLNAVVQNLMEISQRMVGDDVAISFRPSDSLGRIKADPGQIEQVFMNLLVNARDALTGSGHVIITTANAVLDEAYCRQHGPVTPGEYVMLSLSDTGCGMDEATRARIFEPFFTTKEPGKGTGLGLAMVYGIVKQSNGYIWVYSEPQKGTTFELYFPHVVEGVAGVSDTGETPLASTGSETILLVEDDEALRGLVLVMLQESGYRVIATDSAESAMLAVREYTGPIHLLLSDIVMPRTSGIVLAESLKNTIPRIIVMSGYSSDMVNGHSQIPRGMVLLEKPFTRATLLSRVRSVLNS